MRASKIRALIKIVEESDINELEVSSWGRKVSIRKKIGAGNGHKNNPGIIEMPAESRPAPVAMEVATAEPKAAPAKMNLVEIKSPMVGTYYKAPAPDARPYVEVGQTVKAGQVVCIVEAMKLMNEIEAEIAGRIVEVLIENAKPVQFGQALFLVEPV